MSINRAILTVCISLAKASCFSKLMKNYIYLAAIKSLLQGNRYVLYFCVMHFIYQFLFQYTRWICGKRLKFIHFLWTTNIFRTLYRKESEMFIDQLIFGVCFWHSDHFSHSLPGNYYWTSWICLKYSIYLVD